MSSLPSLSEAAAIIYQRDYDYKRKYRRDAAPYSEVDPVLLEEIVCRHRTSCIAKKLVTKAASLSRPPSRDHPRTANGVSLGDIRSLQYNEKMRQLFCSRYKVCAESLL